MTRIKLCGLTRPCDISAANQLLPEYIGFVFAPQSKRYIAPAQARSLKNMLSPRIHAVGVFTNESLPVVVRLIKEGVIDYAQLHGEETDEYIRAVRRQTGKSVIKSFCIRSAADAALAEKSAADYILLDSGSGTGKTFNWEWIRAVKRPYFLAGGLHPGNVREAICALQPYAVDVSSGIETEGYKDANKMAAFVHAARKEEKI